MPDQHDIDLQLKLLSIARGNVRHLLAQVRANGGFNKAPVSILNDLEENWGEIASIKQIFWSWGYRIEDLPTDGPVPPIQPAWEDTQPEDNLGAPAGALRWAGRVGIVALLIGMVFWLWPEVKARLASGPTTTPDRGFATSPPPQPLSSWRGSVGIIGLSLLHTLNGSDGEIWGAQFSPEDGTAFTSSRDGLIRHWRGGEEIGQYASGRDEAVQVGGLAVSPDGTLVAGAYILNGSDRYGEGFVQVYQVADGAIIYTFTGHTSYVWTVAFSPDGRQLASAGADGTIRLWNMENGAADRILRGHTSQVTAVAFSPNGQRLASVSDDGSLRIWDLADGTQVVKTSIDKSFAVAWNRYSEEVASTSADQSVHIIDANTGALIRKIEIFDNAFAVAISPDGSMIATQCQGTMICLWDYQTGEKRTDFGDATPNVIAWSKDGTLLIEGGKDQQARIWSIDY